MKRHVYGCRYSRNRTRILQEYDDIRKYSRTEHSVCHGVSDSVYFGIRTLFSLSGNFRNLIRLVYAMCTYRILHYFRCHFKYTRIKLPYVTLYSRCHNREFHDIRCHFKYTRIKLPYLTLYSRCYTREFHDIRCHFKYTRIKLPHM